jgi:UDP-glucose 4-epimerase
VSQVSAGILVTGGAGFVGSHLVEQLVGAGERVTVLDNLTRGRRAWLHSGAELREVDIRDADGVRGAVADVASEVVVHLAAMHFIPAIEGAPDVAWDVNVNGTRSLIEALEQRPPKLLLFASTAAVYPDRRGAIDESCPPAPLDLYGKTKLEGERLLEEFANRSGTRCVVARIFNIIGKRETNPHVVPELVSQLRRGESRVRLGNLESRRDYTNVTDVAAALHLLLSTPHDGSAIFNVGSGHSVSVGELVSLCEQVLDRPIEVESEPQRRRAQDRLELAADPRLLRETTGWEPARSLRETMSELLTEPDES